jgi:hypothetical protein
MMMRRNHLLQGRSANENEQSVPKAPIDREARIALKEDRARDAKRAMEEYEAERRAVIANTERLRALRLVREADASKATKNPAQKGR